MPMHPRANGPIENFKRMIAKCTRAATIERRSWKQELYTQLINYRGTPHTKTGESPASSIFQSRPYRLCVGHKSKFSGNDEDIRKRDAAQKDKAKRYADRKRYVKVSDIIPEDKSAGKECRESTAETSL